MTGEYLKTYIRTEGYTIEDIARAAGVSSQVIHNRLNAKSISVETLELIAKAMHRSPAVFFYDDNNHMLRSEIQRLRYIIAQRDEEIRLFQQDMQKKQQG